MTSVKNKSFGIPGSAITEFVKALCFCSLLFWLILPYFINVWKIYFVSMHVMKGMLCRVCIFFHTRAHTHLHQQQNTGKQLYKHNLFVGVGNLYKDAKTQNFFYHKGISTSELMFWFNFSAQVRKHLDAVLLKPHGLFVNSYIPNKDRIRILIVVYREQLLLLLQ